MQSVYTFCYLQIVFNSKGLSFSDNAHPSPTPTFTQHSLSNICCTICGMVPPPALTPPPSRIPRAWCSHIYSYGSVYFIGHTGTKLGPLFSPGGKVRITKTNKSAWAGRIVFGPGGIVEPDFCFLRYVLPKIHFFRPIFAYLLETKDKTKKRTIKGLYREILRRTKSTGKS